MSSTANMMRRMPSVFAGASLGSALIGFGVLLLHTIALTPRIILIVTW
jgi:hypothetical protein